jgi:hypothetical protein
MLLKHQLKVPKDMTNILGRGSGHFLEPLEVLAVGSTGISNANRLAAVEE